MAVTPLAVRSTKEDLVIKIEDLIVDGQEANAITVKITLNELKGTYKITPQLTTKQISDVSEKEVKGILSKFNKAVKEAVEYCREWRRDWKKENDGDPNQIDMFDEDED